MSLSDSPAEIIIQVFKCFDKISHATAFSQISHRFNEIWRCNLRSICDVVLPRAIELYDEVYNLRQAQMSTFPVENYHVKFPPLTGLWHINEAAAETHLPEMHQAETRLAALDAQEDDERNVSNAIMNAQHLFALVDIADVALKRFRNSVSLEWARRKLRQSPCKCHQCYSSYHEEGRKFTLTPASRIHFLKAYLRARRLMRLNAIDKAGYWKALESLDLTDFFQILEVMEWMIESYFGDNERGMAGDGKQMSSCYTQLACLQIEFLRFSRGIQRPTDESRARGPSFPLFLDEESICDQTDMAKGVEIADILRLGDEIGFLDVRFDELEPPYWLRKAILWLETGREI